MKLKGISSAPKTTIDGFCGRYNGIKLTIQMAKEAEAAPAPEEPEKQEDRRRRRHGLHRG